MSRIEKMEEVLKTVLEQYESIKEDDCFEDGDCNACAEKNELCWMEKTVQLIRSALALPRRNCDVGTAEEQFERWKALCNQYEDSCEGCPCDGYPYTPDYCFAMWAQMPYEADDKKKGADDEHN